MSGSPSVRRAVLRVAVFVASIALIAAWVAFERTIVQGAGALPAPGGIMLPLLFCGLAVGAMFGAWRGEGAPIMVAGLIGLVPVGFVMALYPGPTRWIGLLDAALVVLGIQLMRTEAPEAGDSE